MLRGICLLAAVALSLIAAPARSQDVPSPDLALSRLLERAHAACGQQPAVDRLSRILCDKRIRIGVREYYPLFGTREGNTRHGYDIDVGRAIAEKLGVGHEFTRVNAATRIPFLAEDRIDLTIATMGHNTQRDRQVRFIRPHYYQSETIVVGPRVALVASWLDMPGRTVCVTIGNGSNSELITHEARLMLFEEAGMLPDRLRDGTCPLAAQDDSFFAHYFTDPAFREAYSAKFGFAQVPWGMAVARTGSDQLAEALDLISQIFHRDGVFLAIAINNHIGTKFLRDQNAVWKRRDCDIATGHANPGCVLPALSAEMQPTSFARRVTDFEAWMATYPKIDLVLPMLKTQPAWSLFLSGIANTLILIVGALAATLAFALVLGAAMGSRWQLLRWPARALTVALQSSPIVLTLVIAAAVANALFPYSAMVVLGAAIVALGLANGSNAGQAISEAMASLRAERQERGLRLFAHALARSATQIVAFLVNAAKGTPIASFIGAPELLSALTDITSFASGRVTTYCLLLVFYTLVVMVVVWLCNRFRGALERRLAAA